MRTHTITIAILCGLLLLPSPASAEKLSLAPINLLERAKGKNVFKIEDGEVNVGDLFIKRVEIGKNTAIITYLNKNTTNKKPDYEFHIYNAYGIEIGRFDDKWLLDTIAPDDLRKENKSFYSASLPETLKYSDIALPADWESAIYIIIEGNEK